MLTEFTNRADSMRGGYLLKTEELLTANKDAWTAAFAEHFISACTRIVKMQAEQSLSALSYLEYTMLYTNFIDRRYISEVWVYGQESYLDRNQRAVCEYDVSFLFVYFDELWGELTALQRQYSGRISAQDITAYMLRALPDFYSYLADIARLALAECIAGEPFISIAKNNIFMINTGDYMAGVQTVFEINNTE